MQPRRPEARYDTVDGAFRGRYDDPFKVQIERRPALEWIDETKLPGEQVSYEAVYAAPVRRRKKKRKRSVTQKAYDKARVSAANGWVLSWMGFWYITFQLPLAVLSAAGLGMALVVYSAISTVIGETVTQFLVENLPVALSTLAAAVAYVAGEEFALLFDPFILFALPFAATFALGLMQLILAWFVYMLMGLNPLSGNAAAAKIATFILALIGTGIPLLNLFPLAVVWCAVVWWHPK